MIRRDRRRAPSAASLVAVLVAIAAPIPGEGQSPETPEARSYAIVMTARLNVRFEGSLQADVVGSVERGSRLCVFEVRDDWARIRTPEGSESPVQGFVSRGFLSEQRASPDELEAMGCPTG
ncbi:MAG: SH3 domain-containing protein [Gemmatimonadota bacterium]